MVNQIQKSRANVEKMSKHITKLVQIKFKSFLGVVKTKFKSYLGTIVNFLISGNVALFILGITIATWLNSLVTPEFVLIIWLIPFSLITLQYVIGPICLFLFLIYLTKKSFKSPKSTWFFFGASLTSLLFAMGTLVEVSVLYYFGTGRNHPEVLIGDYIFPAIYTFKVFRSIFFATLFGLLGHWSEILRRTKDNPKKHLSNDRFVGDDI